MRCKTVLVYSIVAMLLLAGPLSLQAQKAKKHTKKPAPKETQAPVMQTEPPAPKPKTDPFAQAMAIMKLPNPSIEQQDSAFKTFEAAVEAGDPRSYKYMAQCYLEGKGVEPDKVKAEHWYMKGVSAGDADCLYYYGDKLYQNRMERCKGYHYLMRAAKKDNPDAMVKVAQIYTQGLQGNARGKTEESDGDSPKSRQMKDTCLIVVDKAKVQYWYKRALHFYGKNGNPKDSMMVQDLLWKLEPMRLENNENVDLNR